MPKTKIMIVDDHSVVVEGIKKALEDEAEFEVVGTASDGLKALELLKVLKPDIVVMDISMPNLNGIDTTGEIKKKRKQIGIVIFTMLAEREYIINLFRAGISGYVLKEEPISDLILALKSVRSGGTFYSRAVKDILREHMEALETGETKNSKELQEGVAKLSLREKEVFPLLADGKSIREIADILCISPKTVESHKYNIMEKLQVSSVAGLTKLAIKKDLIKL
ncbi:MAG: DNA-binding response regulator [Desulfobacteraceae bacterium]|jgi:DNA-binding NarL/FixJ family response regulator|nr:MAG: DNA-binding response regulator [Desulfobacteraceae bacterium]